MFQRGYIPKMNIAPSTNTTQKTQKTATTAISINRNKQKVMTPPKPVLTHI